MLRPTPRTVFRASHTVDSYNSSCDILPLGSNPGAKARDVMSEFRSARLRGDHRILSLSLRTLRAAKYQDDLSPALSKLCGRYGVSHMTFLVWAGGASHSYPYYCTTYPEAWVTTYLEPGYFDVAPVLDIIRWGSCPWTGLFRAPVRSVRTHGIGSYGLTIPIRGPNGERSHFP